MLTLGYWLPLLAAVGLWIFAWRFILRMARTSERARREMMKDVPHDKNGPGPAADP